MLESSDQSLIICDHTTINTNSLSGVNSVTFGILNALFRSSPKVVWLIFSIVNDLEKISEHFELIGIKALSRHIL